jgi:hypothetical protein
MGMFSLSLSLQNHNAGTIPLTTDGSWVCFDFHEAASWVFSG